MAEAVAEAKSELQVEEAVTNQDGPSDATAINAPESASDTPLIPEEAA
ncbi:MAG: hypothetical protein RJA39_1528, partial [Pseudomonadota bacterium]